MNTPAFRLDKKKLLKIIKLFFAVLFLFLIFYKTGLFKSAKREQIYTILCRAKLGFLFISLLTLILMDISSVIKWRMLLAATKIKIKFSKIFQIYMMGKFFNIIFPSTVGGDAARIIYLNKEIGKRYSLLASVIVERATGLFTLIPLALIVVPFNTSLFYKTWVINYSVLICSGIVIITFLTVEETRFGFYKTFIQNIANRFPKFFGRLGEVKSSILKYRNDSIAIRWAFINSLIFQIFYALNIWLIAHAFGNNLSLIDSLIAAPIIMVISNLPISVGGIGIMEFSFIFTLSFFNITPLAALSMALIVRIQILVDAGFGGYLYSSSSNNHNILAEEKLLS